MLNMYLAFLGVRCRQNLAWNAGNHKIEYVEISESDNAVVQFDFVQFPVASFCDLQWFKCDGEMK